LLDRSFFPSSTCHGVASGEDGTPPLFSKPFTGIYLFAPQKDKCHSNFEKILNAQVYLSFLSTYPHWEQSQKYKKGSCKTVHSFATAFISLLRSLV